MAHRHRHGCIGTLLGLHPDIRELCDLRVIGRDCHCFCPFVPNFREKVGVGSPRLRYVGAPGDDEAGVVPVRRFWNIGLLAPNLWAGGRKVAIPIVKTHTHATDEAQVTASRCVRNHGHRRNRRKPNDAIRPMFFDGVHIGCCHHFIDFTPAGSNKSTQATHALVFLALGIALSNRRPSVHRVL